MTIGAQPLWAFSTTTEDVTIRNSLYKYLGPSEALRHLATRFPSGSAKAEVERRRRLVSDQSGTDDVLISVTQEITQELVRHHETIFISFLLFSASCQGICLWL